jgi:hypothetical protein
MRISTPEGGCGEGVGGGGGGAGAGAGAGGKESFMYIGEWKGDFVRSEAERVRESERAVRHGREGRGTSDGG